MVHPLSIQNHLEATSCHNGAKDQKAALGQKQPLNSLAAQWLLSAEAASKRSVHYNV